MIHGINQVWIHYGELLALGGWGVLLALLRRIVLGRLCREAALEDGGKGRMLKAMTLRFEKGGEVHVGVYDRTAFVRKYLCQERRLGVRLGRWRRLPERWAGLLLAVGFVEASALWFFGGESGPALDRFLAAATMAALVWAAALIFESDSLWEQAQATLLDYVSNTLYPRQIHVYEGFEEEAEKKPAAKKAARAKKEEPEPRKKGVALKKEEEQLFQEVLTDFLGSST